MIQVRRGKVIKTGQALRLTGRLDSDSEHALLVPLYIFKHITHIYAYNQHIYAYFGLIMHIFCIFLIFMFVNISCIFGTAYFVHVSAYSNLHMMAYLPLCIIKLISAYLHLLCLPGPISLINYQNAAGAQCERCFSRQLIPPIFLSFNHPLTPLNTPKVDAIVLGKVVAIDVGQWKVPLPPAAGM